MKIITLIKSWKVLVFSLTIILHIIIIFTVTIKSSEKEKRKDNTIFKMVDIQEYIPPAPIKEDKVIPPPKPVLPEEKIEVMNQEDIAEDIVETEKEVVEVDEATAVIEYLPQHKISTAPGIPTEEILSRVVYPNLAHRQKIEGVVYLELYIDRSGNIRDIKILKEPGYGIGQAALNAVKGLKCTPALANGTPVAVRFRYSVRFTIK